MLMFTLKQFGDGRWQQRVQLPVDKLLAIEQISQRFGQTKSGIQRAFEYWRNKQCGGHVCRDDYEWEPGDDVAATLIDVSPSNPFHFRFMATRFVYFPWMTDKRLAEFPHRDIVNACGVEYHACKTTAEPVGHHISHDLSGFRRDYLRLLLPLTDRSGRVCALACISRHLD